MDYGLTLSIMYPNINKSQYEIMQTADGTIQITRWDPTDVPKPSDSDVVNYWNTQMMDYFRSQKKAELSQQCNQAIIAGFSSSALGVAHTYPSDEEAQRNFHSELDRLNYDPNYTASSFKTLDAGYLSHTKAQLIQVFVDGHTYGRQQIAHLNTLKSQIDAAQTQTDLNAITW